MKKVWMFFSGLLILLLAVTLLYFTGAIYDASDKMQTISVVFQPNDLSTARIGKPLALDELSEKFIRERLIRKFVNEYFYVLPDAEDIAKRTGRNSTLGIMMSADAFDTWRRGIGEEIQKLADANALRTVRITDEIVRHPDSDYWDVAYELKTWENSNNMDLQPTITNGIMHIRLYPEFRRELLETRPDGSEFDIAKYLENGGDPSVIFKFRVAEVR
jgi:hypothetical protein